MTELIGQYYTSVIANIDLLLDNNRGALLIKLIFDRISNKSVFILVGQLLAQRKYHSTLKLLHHSFDSTYWKKRYAKEFKTCYIYEDIAPPNSIGLLEFYQLILRRERIRLRQAPFEEIQLEENGMACSIGKSFLLKNGMEKR